MATAIAFLSVQPFCNARSRKSQSTFSIVGSWPAACPNSFARLSPTLRLPPQPLEPSHERIRRRPRHRRWARRARRGERTRRRRQESAPARPGAGGLARRPGVLVARRHLSGRFARTAPDGHSRQPRTRADRLDGDSRLRPRGGPLAAPVGGGLRRLRRRREAILVARSRHQVLSRGRLGGARRLQRDRTRQFRAALSCRMGDRHGRRRAVRAARAGRRRSGAKSSSSSATA